MAVDSKTLVIQRLGIKDYPPIFSYAESFYAIICKSSHFKIHFLSNLTFWETSWWLIQMLKDSPPSLSHNSIQCVDAAWCCVSKQNAALLSSASDVKKSSKKIACHLTLKLSEFCLYTSFCHNFFIGLFLLDFLIVLRSKI